MVCGGRRSKVDSAAAGGRVQDQDNDLDEERDEGSGSGSW